MKRANIGKLLHLPLIGLEYSGKSTILHEFRRKCVGIKRSFRSLFSFSNNGNSISVIVRFNSVQDEYRNFSVDLVLNKSERMLAKHIGNVDVFLPTLCALMERKSGNLRYEYVTLPLQNSKKLDIQTVAVFLNVSSKFLMSAAPQVYDSKKMAENAVAQFEGLKGELSQHFDTRDLDGDRPFDEVSSIVSDLKRIIVELR